MIIIDGITYNVPIISLDETADLLAKFAERTEDGKIHGELIGVFYNQQIQFGSPTNPADVLEMARLWVKLSESVFIHTVTVPDTDGIDFTFTAYFSNVKRSLRKWDAARTFWKTMTVNFIAEAPART